MMNRTVYIVVILSIFSCCGYFAYRLIRARTFYDRRGEFRYYVLLTNKYIKENDSLQSSNQPVDSNSPPVSWRVIILNDGKTYRTFYSDTYVQYHFNEPWDGPHNKTIPCPSRSGVESADCTSNIFHCVTDNSSQENATYLAVTGDNTAFTELNHKRFSSLKDLTNTIMFVESHNSGIHWMEPRDITIEEASQPINSQNRLCINSNHKNVESNKAGAFVAYANGDVRWLNADIDAKVLRAMLSVEKSETPAQ